MMKILQVHLYIFRNTSNCILLTCEIYYDNYSSINKAVFLKQQQQQKNSLLIKYHSQVEVIKVPVKIKTFRGSKLLIQDVDLRGS